ncbi:MAG: hypothetical protein LBF72_00675 [Holosporales bacterium]|jgi:iron-sulfur cluster assembly protein|nr:hypothetical protein [Holosporales bacterium]
MSRVALFVTHTATEKIKEFAAAREPEPYGVRVLVYKDEFNNINYSMVFVDGASSTDLIFEIAGIIFVTDQNSAIFLNGMTMDFEDSVGIQGFTFKNECLTKSCLNCTGACGRVAVDS